MAYPGNPNYRGRRTQTPAHAISAAANQQHIAEVERLRKALQRIADCDWVMTLPDRMDAVREIARDALKQGTK